MYLEPEYPYLFYSMFAFRGYKGAHKPPFADTAMTISHLLGLGGLFVGSGMSPCRIDQQGLIILWLMQLTILNMQRIQHQASHPTHKLNVFATGLFSKPPPHAVQHTLTAHCNTKASYRRMRPQEPALGLG